MHQDSFSDRILYRIIQGRLRVTVDGLVFYIYEPAPHIVYESYGIYDEVYEECYLQGVYTDRDLEQFLVENDLWTPLGDRELKSIDKEIEDKKVEAFQNFFKPPTLQNIKRQIAALHARQSKLLNQKHAYDHLSCRGAAEQARWEWVLQNSIFDASGNKVIVDANKIYNIYRDSILDNTDIRMVARSNMWRTMWVTGKKSGGVFSRPTTELTKDQLSLLSFSSMYDNVYEHPECPEDSIIEDDDCLDGWFIVQKRKHDKDRTMQTVDGMTKNAKIKNAKEQFFVVGSDEEAKRITDLNDPLTKAKMAQRAKLIEEKGRVKDFDFNDVQQDIEIMKNRAIVENVRGK